MAEQFLPRLADVTAGFPGAVYTPVEVLDGVTAYSPATETGTVPATGIILLSHVIKPGAALTVVSGGTTLVAVATTPGTGQVKISYDLPLLTFHASRIGEAYSVTYTPLRSPLAAQRLNVIQKELAAVQTVASGSIATAGTVQRFAKITGAELAASTSYTLFTAAATIIATGVAFYATGSTGSIIAPEISVGTGTDANQILPTTALTGFTASGKVFRRVLDGGGVIILSGDVVKLKVQTIAGGVSLIATVCLEGYAI